MKVTIKKFRVKSMPSKFGGTWNLIEAQFNETGEDVYQLSGFGSKFTEKLKIGDVLTGYVSERTWTGQNGPQTSKNFNKITAEYVYDLLLKMNPNIESIQTLTPQTLTPVQPADGWVSEPVQDDGWNSEDVTF